MASVRKRSGSWQARWDLPNGKRRSETRRGWTKGAALEYAKEREAAAARTPWVTSGAGKVLLNEYGPAVLNARSIGDKRLRDDAAAWKNRIGPHFDGLRLFEVTPDDVRKMVSTLVAAGYAPSTVRGTYQLVAYVFATAQVDGLIVATPCVRVSLPKRNPEDEVVPAPPESVVPIADAIDKRYSALVYFLAATGCRIGEALGVTVKDITWVDDRYQVTISKTVHDDANIGPTKSRRSRKISLPRWYEPILREHLQSLDHPYLFPSGEGKYLPPRRFSSRYWRPAVRAAGFPDVTPHQLRHLHATELIANGVSLTEVAQRLGHRNSRVTAEVYAKWIQPDDSGAADATPDYSARRQPEKDRQN